MNGVRVRVERRSGTAGSRAGRGRAGGGSGGGMENGNKRGFGGADSTVYSRFLSESTCLREVLPSVRRTTYDRGPVASTISLRRLPSG